MSKDKDIKPDFVVIDEADLLLETDKNVSRHTNMLLDEIRGRGKARNKKLQKDPQFFVSTSSFPHRIGSRDSFDVLSQYFDQLQPILGVHKHEIPRNIDLFFIETHKLPNPKLAYLGDILKKRYTNG